MHTEAVDTQAGIAVNPLPQAQSETRGSGVRCDRIGEWIDTKEQRDTAVVLVAPLGGQARRRE